MHAPDPERLLASEVAAREATDYRFSWGSYIGWTILTLGLYTHYGTYRLIQRRTDHAKRRLVFSAALWHVLSARATEAGREAQAQPGLDNLSRVHRELEAYEQKHKRNPALLVILRVVTGTGLGFFFNINLSQELNPHPVFVALGTGASLVSASVGAYVNHFLNADLRFFERWEDSLFEQSAWTLEQIGVPVRIASRDDRIPKRETAVYVGLTVITLGLFAIWWRYAMMRDGNEHFNHDDQVEDRILHALGVRTDVTGPPLPPID